jgi:hypothetical protein
MRGIPRHVILFLWVAMMMAAQTARADISITVTGLWQETVNKTHLIAGAGSDLQTTFTSVSGQVTIDISGTSDSADAWRIDVKKVDSGWNTNLHAHVMRTSDGTGGSVSGGGAFQEATNINAPFFSGSGDVTGIKLQLRMTGASVQINPAYYGTVLYYTVVDIQ